MEFGLNMVFGITCSQDWTENLTCLSYYMVDGGSAFCTFLELILVIFNEFISEVAELNVVIFHNLTSVR